MTNLKLIDNYIKDMLIVHKKLKKSKKFIFISFNYF